MHAKFYPSSKSREKDESGRWKELFEGKMKRRMSIESVTSKNCELQKVFTLE